MIVADARGKGSNKLLLWKGPPGCRSQRQMDRTRIMPVLIGTFAFVVTLTRVL
jgi:hypothetical protein